VTAEAFCCHARAAGSRTNSRRGLLISVGRGCVTARDAGDFLAKAAALGYRVIDFDPLFFERAFDPCEPRRG